MVLNLENLDAETRRYMAEEVERDQADGRLYIGKTLNDHGMAVWIDLLREAVRDGTDDTLADQLSEQDCLKTHTERRTPSGGVTMVKVAHNANTMLAEGEFNRFYCRGLCRRAIAAGIPWLQVYRAKAVANPRPESEAKLGQLVDPAAVLADLRSAQGVEPALGLPPGPNSGLSLRMPS